MKGHSHVLKSIDGLKADKFLHKCELAKQCKNVNKNNCFYIVFAELALIWYAGNCSLFKLGNIWAGRIPQSIKNYSWKSNDFVIFFSRLRFLIEMCQCWKVVQCYLEEKINFGVIFELKNTTCIKAKFDFSTMKLWRVHLNEIQNKNTCNLV